LSRKSPCGKSPLQQPHVRGAGNIVELKSGKTWSSSWAKGFSRTRHENDHFLDLRMTNIPTMRPYKEKRDSFELYKILIMKPKALPRRGHIPILMSFPLADRLMNDGK